MECIAIVSIHEVLCSKNAAPAIAARAPLPLAGRGRGWGYRARATLNVKARARCTLASANNAFSRVFTPPLTPPRQGEGDSGALVARLCHAA